MRAAATAITREMGAVADVGYGVAVCVPAIDVEEVEAVQAVVRPEGRHAGERIADNEGMPVWERG